MWEAKEFRWMQKVWFRDSEGKCYPVQIVGLHYNTTTGADGYSMMALSDEGFGRYSGAVKGTIGWVLDSNTQHYLFAVKPRGHCECCGQLLPEEVIP